MRLFRKALTMKTRLLLVPLLAVLFTCTNPVLDVTLSGPGQEPGLGTAIIQLPSIPADFLAKQAALVSQLQLSISGTDMTTISYAWRIDSMPAEPVVITGIPAGTSRVFSGALVNSSGVTTHAGSVTIAIGPGDTVEVTLTLRAQTGTAIVCIEIEGLPSSCDQPSDPHLLAHFAFEELSGDITFDETGRWSGTLIGAQRVPGPVGNAISCTQGTYVAFDTIVPHGTPNGTVELMLRVSADFQASGRYSIFGDRACRLAFFYKEGRLYFLKNHMNVFKFVSAPVVFQASRWYRLAATWGDRGMRLFLNDSLVARNSDTSPYIKTAGYDSSWYQMAAGHKLWCCMEGIGEYDRTGDYWLEGAVDEIKLWGTDRFGDVPVNPSPLGGCLYDLLLSGDTSMTLVFGVDSGYAAVDIRDSLLLSFRPPHYISRCFQAGKSTPEIAVMSLVDSVLTGLGTGEPYGEPLNYDYKLDFHYCHMMVEAYRYHFKNVWEGPNYWSLQRIDR
jgi:hypothetical protein